MTSSVSGILSTPSQGKYAAANAYLDSFARFRHTRSKAPATSVVLPMVLVVGIVAENVELEDALKRKGMYGVDEEHLLQSFEAAMMFNTLETVPEHVVVGLDPAPLQKAVNDTAAVDSFRLEDARFSHIVHGINSYADDAAGIDSMIGAELRNWIFKEYMIDVPFQQLLGPRYSDNMTIEQFPFHLSNL
ncbi:uncharacterized protein TRIVIDRAFT_222611 [Trichoderma virens Gv29-8]|uniref:Ketoreductase (KR) domain-containing protein n=1 Tax=Hypocrea virens (strain Gv29-8 / FGSC 10586) TaxID=413071 RepID=G9MUE8_HYPVG|nr:uncharacterized protein TRIVIDRAFT_222611 [Trichoderma virens Gv29-8]EHK21941.1 hypothetical protein TRIVIDRAFT_222611 [Trichoderma virens Gv29-8]UKZ52457.1 hypothetical protein TrVGV298_006234 [Trichoderma virens]